jgi:hypothetical protein
MLECLPSAREVTVVKVPVRKKECEIWSTTLLIKRSFRIAEFMKESFITGLLKKISCKGHK